MRSHGILPVKGLLFKRGISDSGICQLCHKAFETVDHALWGCSVMRSGWVHCPFFSALKSFKAVDFVDRCSWVVSSVHSRGVLQFLVACWMAWNDRNFQLHGGVRAGRNLWAGAEQLDHRELCRKLDPQVRQ
ncbi:hypothetical protein ACOSQ4_016316 [Xanthoceras sorbifolium]